MSLTLHLTDWGSAELLDGDAQCWASDADEAFADEFGTEILDENDLEAILQYLIDSGELSESEVDECEIRVDVLSEDLIPREGDEDDGEDAAEGAA